MRPGVKAVCRRSLPNEEALGVGALSESGLD